MSYTYPTEVESKTQRSWQWLEGVQYIRESGIRGEAIASFDFGHFV